MRCPEQAPKDIEHLTGFRARHVGINREAEHPFRKFGRIQQPPAVLLEERRLVERGTVIPAQLKTLKFCFGH